MSKSKKLEITCESRYRYRTGSKKERGEILRTFCELSGYSRKHAGRILRGKFKSRATGKPRGRKPKYQYPEFLEALKNLWLSTDQMCGRNLKAAIPVWLRYYEGEFGALSESTINDLLQVSPATIDRLLQAKRVKHPKGRCCTRPGTLLRHQIPIRTDYWDADKPGYIECDTVHHCGESTAGVYALSLTMTDIYSGWTECRGVWSRTAQAVKEGVIDVEKTLPFPILGFDCDNGKELLNYEMLRYFLERPKIVPFTRSREYQKNDNAHVEEKNWMHVRQLLGYERFDVPEVVVLINDLYINAWNPYRNFFCPTMKLISKERIGAKVRKLYQPSHTPYQRLMVSPYIDDNKKAELQNTYAKLNPFELRRVIQRKLRAIFQLLNQPRVELLAS